jgi:hypothetical protein
MPLKLITEPQIEWFCVYYNEETQEPWSEEDDEKVLADAPDKSTMGTASFGLVLLTAGDMYKITNRLYSVDRKGKSKFEYGTASKEKVLAACPKVKNVGDVTDPEQETKFTPKMYDGLPNWVVEQVLERVNEMNNLMPEEEQD